MNIFSHLETKPAIPGARKPFRRQHARYLDIIYDILGEISDLKLNQRYAKKTRLALALKFFDAIAFNIYQHCRSLLIEKENQSCFADFDRSRFEADWDHVRMIEFFLNDERFSAIFENYTYLPILIESYHTLRESVVSGKFKNNPITLCVNLKETLKSYIFDKDSIAPLIALKLQFKELQRLIDSGRIGLMLHNPLAAIAQLIDFSIKFQIRDKAGMNEVDWESWSHLRHMILFDDYKTICCAIAPELDNVQLQLDRCIGILQGKDEAQLPPRQLFVNISYHANKLKDNYYIRKMKRYLAFIPKYFMGVKQFSVKQKKAIFRILQVLGECSNKLSDEYKNRSHQLFWDDIEKIRDMLAHLEQRTVKTRIQQILQDATEYNAIFLSVVENLNQIMLLIKDVETQNEFITLVENDGLTRFYNFLHHRFSEEKKQALYRSVPLVPMIDVMARCQLALSILRNEKIITSAEFKTMLADLKQIGLTSMQYRKLCSFFRKQYKKTITAQDVKKAEEFFDPILDFDRTVAIQKLHHWINERNDSAFNKTDFNLTLCRLQVPSDVINTLWLPAYDSMHPSSPQYKPAKRSAYISVTACKRHAIKLRNEFQSLFNLIIANKANGDWTFNEDFTQLLNIQNSDYRITVEFCISNVRKLVNKLAGELQILTYYISEVPNLQKAISAGGIIFQVESDLEYYIFKSNQLLHKEFDYGPYISPLKAVWRNSPVVQQFRRSGDLLILLFGERIPFNMSTAQRQSTTPTLIETLNALIEQLNQYQQQLYQRLKPACRYTTILSLNKAVPGVNLNDQIIENIVKKAFG